MAENPEQGRAGQELPFVPPETLLESIDGLVPVPLPVRTGTMVNGSHPTPYPVPPGAVKQSTEPRAFRPLRRPPMALLYILDDNSDTGECVRLRSGQLQIGRTQGDVLIPHDTMISGLHAEVSRQVIQGRHRWVLTDLNSTNGVYVRIGALALRPGQELLMGSRRYRFDEGPRPKPSLLPTSDAAPSLPAGTQDWERPELTDLLPSLVELKPAREGPRFFLEQPDLWLGRDPTQCALVVADDPLLNARHARLYQDEHGDWHLESSGTLNGIWFRLRSPLPIEGTCQFQLGEQRFILRVP